MTIRKSNDYKITVVNYYLVEDKHKKKFVRFSSVNQ